MKYVLYTAENEPTQHVFFSKQMAELCTTSTNLKVVPVCPGCCSPNVEELTGKGFKVGAWECKSCGRTGC